MYEYVKARFEWGEFQLWSRSCIDTLEIKSYLRYLSLTKKIYSFALFSKSMYEYVKAQFERGEFQLWSRPCIDTLEILSYLQYLSLQLGNEKLPFMCRLMINLVNSDLGSIQLPIGTPGWFHFTSLLHFILFSLWK